jgi:hypothetical protein
LPENNDTDTQAFVFIATMNRQNKGTGPTMDGVIASNSKVNPRFILQQLFSNFDKWHSEVWS